ncbi:MAG: hypothetical protein ACI9X4_002262 [Glaciecola sp.]|jgi:hypothetical protein
MLLYMKYPENHITCLGCTQPIQGTSVINRMANGTSCKICVERVLDAQPSLLVNEEVTSESGPQHKMAPILHFPAMGEWDDAPEPA